MKSGIKSAGLVTALLAVALLTGCSPVDRSAMEYHQQIAEWDSLRIANLKKPRGWLSLIDLQWLKNGTQSFGCGEGCDIRIDASCPDTIGFWTIAGDTITFTAGNNVLVNVGDSAIASHITRSDLESDPDIFSHKNLFWMVINRGGQYGVRVWDTLSHHRLDLRKIERFPVDDSWKLEAEFIPASPTDSVVMTNALGMTVAYRLEGTVAANKDGSVIEIHAIDGGPDELFLIFSDLTTGVDTYDGGRYLYIPRPVEGSMTTLDFNKAYNPPCVFTDYATCLLPPASNRLDIAIDAGEKYPDRFRH